MMESQAKADSLYFSQKGCKKNGWNEKLTNDQHALSLNTWAFG